MTLAIKGKVREAFKDLREQGYVALMSLPCCMTCSLEYLRSEKGVKQGDDYAFYHQQDAKAFDRAGELSCPLHIRWGGQPGAIIEALSSHGLTVRWDGSAGKTIQVLGHASHHATERRQ